jgi:hypothetical protein
MPRSPATKSPAKAAAFSNASHNWKSAIFDLSKLQGAAPISGASLPFVLVSYACMRRLNLAVNERVLVCGYSGISSGETLDDSILLAEDCTVCFEKSLVGRVWPTTMTSGATALLDEASRSRLGQQYGEQTVLARFDPLVSCLGIANRLFLSPSTDTEVTSKIGAAAGILLAHQLSKFTQTLLLDVTDLILDYIFRGHVPEARKCRCMHTARPCHGFLCFWCHEPE